MIITESLRDYCPLSDVVQQAALEMYEDFSNVERLYTNLAADALNELTNQTLKTGLRRGLFNVNKKFNTIDIDCDFKEEFFIGRINECGEKVPFHINWKLADIENVDVIPDDTSCAAKCGCSFPKQMCNDLQTTEVVSTIEIDGETYNVTKTFTLQPDGNYIAVVTTPYYNNVHAQVEYLTQTSIVGALELAACGCVVNSPQNTEVIKSCNPTCYSIYCCNCCDQVEAVGYKVFRDTKKIKFDKNLCADQVYMEWRGSLPKKDGQYIVPIVARRTLIEMVKYRSIQNKKGVPQWEKRDQFDAYLRARNNMDMVCCQFSIHDIVYALTVIPKFNSHI